MREWMRAERRRRKDAKLCTMCGTYPAIPDYATCEKCLTRQKLYAAGRRRVMHEGTTIHQLMEMVANYCDHSNRPPSAADLDVIAEEDRIRQATMRANLRERALD